MKKITLIIIFNFLILDTGFSLFNSVSLLYDKSEVYNGNSVKVKLKATNTKGKIFFSDVDKKYDCNQFEIKVTKGGAFKSNLKTHFDFVVDDEADTISIELMFLYGTNKRFSFNIPVYNYSDEIKTLKLGTNTTVESNSIANFSVTALMDSGDYINVSTKGKLRKDDFKFTVLEGGELTNKFGGILIGNYNHCTTTLKVKVELRDNPSIFCVSEYKIKRNKKIVDINYRNTQTNCLNLKLDVCYDSCSNDSLLKIEIFNENNVLLSTYHLSLNDDIILVDVSGRNGADGVDGIDGVYGKAKDGGDGVDGENGIDVFIYYTNSVIEYKSKVIILSYGGRGGRYGKGGSGASSYENQNGAYISYKDGMPGRDGRDGRDGIVHYIQVTK